MFHNYNSSADKYSHTKKANGKLQPKLSACPIITKSYKIQKQSAFSNLYSRPTAYNSIAVYYKILQKYKNNPPSAIYIPAQQLITTPKSLYPPDSSKKNTKFIMPHAQPFQTYYQNRTLSTYPKYALLCKSPLNTMPNLYHLTKTVEPLIIFPFAFI